MASACLSTSGAAPAMPAPASSSAARPARTSIRRGGISIAGDCAGSVGDSGVQNRHFVGTSSAHRQHIGSALVAATIVHAVCPPPFVILRHAFIPLDNARLAHLCGSMDEHLRDIESALGVSITRRNESLRIEGPKAAAERAVALLQSL